MRPQGAGQVPGKLGCGPPDLWQWSYELTAPSAPGGEELIWQPMVRVPSAAVPTMFGPLFGRKDEHERNGQAG